MHDLIIPHYGVGALTDLCRRCLESIRLHSTDYRLIFVDNASPEFDLLEEEIRLHPHVLIRNTSNLGFVKAVNQGLWMSTADYVVILNNDIEVVDSWLEKLRVPLQGDVGLSGPRTTAEGSWQGRWTGMEGIAVLPRDYMLAFFCVMIRREVIEKVGVLDESFGVGFADDDDYCHRAQEAGFRLALIQDLVIPHHHRSTFKTIYSGEEIQKMQRAALEKFQAKIATEPPVSPQPHNGSVPLVTCVMPTADRAEMVPFAIGQFLAQDYPELELLVVDSGHSPVRHLVPDGGRIRYLRVPPPVTLGALRNLACHEAAGEVIVHWDDDDWMAPWRISYQVAELLSYGAELCGLDRLHFVDIRNSAAWEYVYPENEMAWVAGGTMCYRRELWARNPFPEVSVGEDNLFVWSPVPKRILAHGNPEFYVASVHGRNTSPKLVHQERWHARPFQEVRQLMGDRWPEFRSLIQSISKGDPDPARAKPLISCILPTRDRRDFARQAIRCFTRQTYHPVELIVVDDGIDSVEDLCEVLPNVRHVRCPARPMNLGAKLNLGIEQASGDVVQKLDDDDYYGPFFLERAQTALERCQSPDALVAWCCFLVLLPGEEHPRFSGHGWSTGASFCFHRGLWEKVRFRDVPAEVDRCFLEDSRAPVQRVCAPESLLVVRHGNHTWRHMAGGGSVEDYFGRQPIHRVPVSSIVDPADREFYARLTHTSSEEPGL